MLTGKTRYRLGGLFKRKMILQVEYTKSYTKDLNGSGYYDEWTNNYWRDATFQDIQELNIKC